ncbi:MAG: hypothetical protein PHV42_04655, partial [Candidatus Pacebacteria bacterium]|nr:hypothetical protein [Candidatus Paceibacterota bacterium]
MPEFKLDDEKKKKGETTPPSHEEARDIFETQILRTTPEQASREIESAARDRADTFIDTTERTPDLTESNKEGLIKKTETAVATLDSKLETPATEEFASKDSEPTQEEKEKKEYTREEVLDSLDASIDTLQKEYALLSPGQKNSPKAKELEWVIESVKLAKAKSLDQGQDRLTVELHDEHGNKIGEQQEGIPVDGILKYLELYTQRLKKMCVPEEKADRFEQLERVISENDKMMSSGGVVPENVAAFQRKNIAERDAILALAEKDPDYIRAQEMEQTLQDSSKPYFEAHFGKPSDTLTPEEQQRQHLRTQTEAKFISSDYRATGNPESDYKMAMDAMSQRRELELPKEKVVESAPTPEPILEKPVEPIIDVASKAPKSTPDIASPLEPRPEVKVEPERAKQGPSLEFLRNAYAVAVNGRKKLFGRTSESFVEQARIAYENALKEQFQEQLENEFAGLDIKNAKVLENYVLRQAELTVGSMKEREVLIDAMNETQERTAGKIIKDFWKRHTKLRMAISAGLTAGAFFAGATGNIPVMAALLAGKVAMSGVGTTLTVEAAWEGGRQKYGKTGELKEEKIGQMSDEELEED